MSAPSLEEFQIGWICALPVEAAAAQEMLDESFGILEEQDTKDSNIYTLGRVGKHNVVIACLGGQYGTTSATTVANNMIRTFSRSLRVGLMVGIGGGIPSNSKDVRLGDIVISYPNETCGGVFQYDMGKIIDGDKFQRTGALNAPPRLLLTAVNAMRAAELRDDPHYPAYIQKATQRNSRTRRNFSRPESDRLFRTEHEHVSANASCDGCPSVWEIQRHKRDESYETQAHYGIIASGNAVVKNGQMRDRLQEETHALCFEMEAAGLMTDFPCIIIRGICDYADSHKNKDWQGYAALSAAAYAKELLEYVPRGHIAQEKLVVESCSKILEKINDIGEKTEVIYQKNELAKLQIANGAEFNSYSNQHEEECLPGTRTDLRHHISQWALSADGKGIFWLNGMAGTGKSTIARTMARSFQEMGLLGASFFFKKGERDRGKADRLFPTIVTQLTARIPQLMPSISRVIENDKDISAKALPEQFRELLLRPLESLAHPPAMPLVVLLDALDECEERDIGVVLRLLPQLQNSSNGVILRFFLTSRPELPIRLGFRKLNDTEHQGLILHEIPMPIIKHDIAVFLRNQFSNIKEEYSLMGYPLDMDWPGEDSIQALVAMAVPLFIYAATVCRFVRERNPQERLAAILSNSATNPVSKLEGIYAPILKQLRVGQDEGDSISRNIVGAIVLLMAPLPVDELARFLGMPKTHLINQLGSLHSVLSIPTDTSLPVRILHLSFRDFLLSTQGDFHVNEKHIHGVLAAQCLRIMGIYLQRNICSLSSYGMERKDIADDTINQNLPASLRYSCQYWAKHLMESQGPCLMDDVFLFLQQHFLHWVEAMSIMGRVSEIVGIIYALESVTKDTRMSEFLRDARYFILKYGYMISIAPLQLYCSGLVFAPTGSIIRKAFFTEIPTWIRRLPKPKKFWDDWTMLIDTRAGRIKELAFSPDGLYLASVGQDGVIKLWEPTTGALKQTIKARSSKIYGMVFSPNSQLIASRCSDNTAKLWEPATGVLKQTIAQFSGSVTFSPDGQLLASGYEDTIRIWGVATGAIRLTINAQTSGVNQLAFSPDGQQLASGGKNGTIKIWEPTTGVLQKTLKQCAKSVYSVAFSPDGQLLAGSCHDGFGGPTPNIKLWDPATGKLKRTIRRRHWDITETVAFSPDGRVILGAASDSVKLWEPKTGKPMQTIWTGDREHDKKLSFSVDSRFLAMSQGDGIKIWEVPTKILTVLSMNKLKNSMQSQVGQHPPNIVYMTSSPSGGLLAAVRKQGRIELWNSVTGKMKKSFETPEISDSDGAMWKRWPKAVGQSPWDLKFTEDNQYLETSFESFDIRRYSSKQEPNREEGNTPMTIHNQWLSFGGEQTLWIPRENRSTKPVICGNKLALVDEMEGAWRDISFIEFNK